MGKGVRTSSKPSSSARAAEVLASKAAGAGGFGFGGFAGSSAVGPNVAGFGFGAAAAERLAPAASAADPSGSAGVDAAGGEVPLGVQVDGELAQCIRHLAKKDPITKTKALQNLRAVVPSRSTADLLTAMPPWIYMYNRLILDPSRAVRSETASTLASLLTALGKAVAPHLKALIGPWFLAMYDTYGDAAEASRSAFAAAFPATRRQLDVVLYCRTELTSYLKNQLAATPQQLGDVKKDSPEELEERHERVQAACLAALAALIGMMMSPPQTEGTTSTAGEAGEASTAAAAAAPPGGREEVLAAVREVVCRPGFWKGTAGSKSAAVRRASYGLARVAAQRAGGQLLAGCAAESAVCVLGALGEKEPGNHGAMWEAVLTYGKFFPEGWAHVNLRKMVLPRLSSLLRHGCFGSAPGSLPALLPLLALLPPDTLGPGPDVLVTLLGALWAGMQDPACASRAAKSASLSAYRECLAWGLANSARLAAPPAPPHATTAAAEAKATCAEPPAAAAASPAPAAAVAAGDAGAGYCRALLQGSLATHVLPAALGSGSQAEAEAAREVVVGLASDLAAAAPVPLDCLTEAVSRFVGAALEGRMAAATGGGGGVGELAAACEGVAALLAQLRRDDAAAAAAARAGLTAQVVAAAAASLTSAGPGGLPPEASQLLAMLLREYGSTAAVGALAPSPAPKESAATAAADGAAGLGAAPVSAVADGGGGGGLSLASLVAALRSGPISSPSTAGTADLLVALCTAHPDPSAVWDHILAALITTHAQTPTSTHKDQHQDQHQDEMSAADAPAAPASAAAPAAPAVAPAAGAFGEEELQRVLLLLQRCCAAAGGGGSGGSGASQARAAVAVAAAAAAPLSWTSASLDALAVRLARFIAEDQAPAAAGEGASGRGQRQQQQGQEGRAEEHEAALLSAVLGGNTAGLLMIRPQAALQVVQALKEHLAAAAGRGGGGSAAAAASTARAACFAVDALRGPLSSGGCGLWALLPDAACDALAALAALSWQAPSDRPTVHPRGAADAEEDSSSGSGSGGEEEEEEDEDVSAGSESGESAPASSDEEEEEGSGGAGREPGARAAIRAARSAAAQFWRETRPLATAAAVALPPGRVEQLTRRLAGLLAADAASSRLSPRDWAAHAAQLLEAAPGGAAQRQGVLEVLLGARPEWRTWSRLAGAGGAGSAAGGPAAVRSAESPAAAAAAAAGGGGGVRPEASLEYLARLVEAAGPGAVLGAAGGAYGDAEGDDDAEEERGAKAEVEAGGEGGRSGGGRCWVLVELLCSHHAAAAQKQERGQAGSTWGQAGAGHGAAEGDDDEEEEEEEEVPPALSGSWRRAVGRAAEALLGHVVYEAVGEVEAGEDGGGGGGVFGSLLRSLVDELAEGCRDGGSSIAAAAGPSAAAHAGEVGAALSPTQAAFLEALCHVAALMERASASASAGGGYGNAADGDGGAQSPHSHSHPPLLPHQQRLCRYWLSTCRPADGAAGPNTGLPPQALLRLLPLAAGPVRRAAAAAAAASRSGAGEELLAASGLPELSGAWVRHCLDRPAVLLEPEGPAVAVLELAAACFPTPDARGGGSSSSGAGARAAAAALELARSGGAGLAASERPLLKRLVHHQLVRHAGMAAARRQHGEAAPGAHAQPPGPDAAPSAAAATAAARAVVMRLAHAAVVYDWRGLGQPEWHALLQAVQDHMSEAVAALGAVLAQLAAAARAAADVLLQQPPGTTPPGPLALQLLRKLCQRGVLARVAQGRQLQAAAAEALGGCGVGPAARDAAQLAAVLTELQDELSAEAGGGTAAGAAAASREYGNAMAACCSHAMQLAMQLGGVECFGAAFGPGASAAVAAWLERHRDFWAAVTRCAGRALAPGREHLGSQAGAAAAAAQAAALEAAGLDSVGALLVVALTPGSHLLQPVAYRLLLGDALLPSMTLAAASATAGGGGAADVELPEYSGDDVAFLMAGGVRPEMAPWLLPPAAPVQPARGAAGAAGAAAGGGAGGVRVYLTAWSLLLAHALALEASSRGLAVLRAVLREVEPLVARLLDQLVPQLGLTHTHQQRQQGAKQAPHRHHHHHVRAGHGGGAAAAAAAASGAATDVDRWRLAEVLREVGLPCGPHAVRATCRALYRAVLRALPATARGWFGDLRDRGLAAAVEAYTAAAEGPALLAAEIASVQSLKRRGGGDGDEDRFTVRASSASREVVASLEVEDGAVLELAVKLPACLPLRAPEVECRRKVGVSDTRLRKWLLSIATFLRHQNGSVADALCLWKRNVDSEFEGVEACLICYSVISSVNGQLPRLVCRTCNVRFHPACLYKWFKSAGKSQCPHCQALW